MNWTKDKSILLTKICTYAFMLLLAAVDIGGFWLIRWYAELREMSRQNAVGLLTVIYIGSVFAWILLCKLFGLLSEIRQGRVFTPENVTRLRLVSWCCVWGAIVSAAGALFYLPMIFIAAAAGFMALIVRIVKNAFQQALDMKSELDFTV